MRLVPLAGRPEDAVRDALLSHGWEGDLSRTTAAGLESLAYHLTQLDGAALQALVTTGGRLGLDVVTGEDWALLAGPRSRLAALARPWTAPESLVELAAGLARAARAGVGAERIVLDPGLGFGKTAGQNIELLRGLAALRSLGRPLLVGPSRKRFLGDLTARAPEERDLATAASCALAWESGARLFRVHEPGPARDALAIASAIRPR